MITTDRKKILLWLIPLSIALLVICVSICILLQTTESTEPSKDITMLSTLEKIIDMNELSTFTAVYNGVAIVTNDDNSEQIDYYVSYEAKINAGIDFEKLTISVDTEAKTVNVKIPDIQITDVIVDIASLDFIFENDAANTSTITQEAFKSCEADAKSEGQAQEAIYDLARQNAKNIITALMKPIIEQLDAEYSLVIQ